MANRSFDRRRDRATDCNPATETGADASTGCRAGREGATCVDGLSRADVLSLLANEDRLAVLEAVLRARRREASRYPVAFSTLREAVGVEDSGRFAYHLDRLTGRLLTRTGDGYALRETDCERLSELLRTCLDGR